MNSEFYLRIAIVFGLVLQLQPALGAPPPAIPNGTATPTTVATKAEDVTPSVRKVKFGLLTANYLNVESAKNGQGDLAAFNQIRADYKVAPDRNLRFNMLFSNSWGTKSDGKQEFKILDPYVQYSRSSLAKLPFDIQLNASARGYLPVSEVSQLKGQKLGTRLAAEFVKQVTPDFSLSFNLLPTYNLQSQNVYEQIDAAGKATKKSNNSFNLWYYLSGSVNLTSKLNFVQDLGLMRYWYKSDLSSGVVGKTKEFFYADSSLTYTINDQFDVGIGLSSYLTRDLLAQENSFSMYRADETDYYFTGTARF